MVDSDQRVRRPLPLPIRRHRHHLSVPLLCSGSDSSVPMLSFDPPLRSIVGTLLRLYFIEI